MDLSVGCRPSSSGQPVLPPGCGAVELELEVHAPVFEKKKEAIRTTATTRNIGSNINPQNERSSNDSNIVCWFTKHIGRGIRTSLCRHFFVRRCGRTQPTRSHDLRQRFSCFFALTLTYLARKPWDGGVSFPGHDDRRPWVIQSQNRVQVGAFVALNLLKKANT